MSRGRKIIIGAGPAGLTAGWQLRRLGEEALILEGDPEHVGGLARTVEREGNRFDLGGHRFYSKSKVINELWKEMLPEPFIKVPRLSRIYHEGKYLHYPIEPLDIFKHLGSRRTATILASYLQAKLMPRRPEQSVEDWLINRFGRQLYATFFMDFTEKVWGVPCSQMSRDWASQRIRGLSIRRAIKDALFPPEPGSELTTLIRSFRYPRLGPGQLWESVAAQTEQMGGQILKHQTVVRVNHSDGKARSVVTQNGTVHTADDFVSTMPLRNLVNALDPAPPAAVLRAASKLQHRDFLTVVLLVLKTDLFPDNWIYIHDHAVRVGRVQNYGNWSEDMVADSSRTSLGLEYFCSRGDDMWTMTDRELIDLAGRELQTIGLAEQRDCMHGYVQRIHNAYPIYDLDYQSHRQILKTWISANLRNVYPAGRGGLHSYSSMDHAMMAALLAVRNMTEGTTFDVWAVNAAVDYAEVAETSEQLELDQVLSPVSTPCQY